MVTATKGGRRPRTVRTSIGMHAGTKRSVVIGGKQSTRSHKTSVSLEDLFWLDFRLMAAEQGKTLGEVLEELDMERHDKDNDLFRHNLSSALRVRVHEYWRRPRNPVIDAAATAALANDEANA